MKIKDGFIFRTVADSHIVVPTGERCEEFNGMITLNSSGAFLWELLEKDHTEEELVQAILENYDDVEEAYARTCVREFIEELEKKHLLNEA